MKPNQGSRPPAAPDTAEDGPDSVMPGDRSGEGSDDLFKHIERDLERREGLSGTKPPGGKQE